MDKNVNDRIAKMRQGNDSFHNFINRKAVDLGQVTPHNKWNPRWRITLKGRVFVIKSTTLKLDERKIPEILRLVRKKYSGWDNFDNPSFQKDETDYKQKASKKAQSLLSKIALTTLLETADYSEIIRRIQEVARSTNLMHLSHPDSGDLRLLNLSDLDEAAFCREFFALLYNAEPTATRLNRFFAYVQQQGLTPKWTFPTYFLFLCYPDKEMCIKPMMTRWFVELMNGPKTYPWMASGVAYKEILSIAFQVKEAMSAYGCQDMIDTHSLLWVAYRVSENESKDTLTKGSIMTDDFTWINIYQELAATLRGWEERQPELIAFLEDIRTQGYTITPLQDKNQDGEQFLLREIDPFTFFGVFNRGIKTENRIGILKEIKRYFQLKSPVPSDFSSIPVLNNMKSWFFPYHASRKADDIQCLWRIFQLIFQENPLQDQLFLEAFDDALSVHNVNVNLTMGLFWIRPEIFLSLDSLNRTYLEISIPSSGLTAQFYANTLQDISAKGQSFPELSLAAWVAANNKELIPEITQPIHKTGGYWLVGAYWSGNDSPDQTKRFLEEGVWKNGYNDRYLDQVKSMKVNDKIAIKASTTQRKNLPFDAQDHTVSLCIIKATGTIIANRDDGKTIEIEWDLDYQERRWYFFTNRSTIWHLKTDEDYQFKQYSEKLIDFVWYSGEQDYQWFCKQWWGDKDLENEALLDEPELSLKPYSVEDIIASGVFLGEEDIHKIMNRLRAKKAMILQGAPGVGKTFIARKLAYALMEEVAADRLEMV